MCTIFYINVSSVSSVQVRYGLDRMNSEWVEWCLACVCVKTTQQDVRINETSLHAWEYSACNWLVTLSSGMGIILAYYNK